MQLKISIDVHTERQGAETVEEENRLAELADQHMRDCVASLIEAARAEGLDVHHAGVAQSVALGDGPTAALRVDHRVVRAAGAE